MRTSCGLEPGLNTSGRMASYIIKQYVTSLLNHKLKAFFEAVNPDDWEFSPGVVQYTARIRGLVSCTDCLLTARKHAPIALPLSLSLSLTLSLNLPSALNLNPDPNEC